MNRIFGAPSGARFGVYGSQSGVELRTSRSIFPLKPFGERAGACAHPEACRPSIDCEMARVPATATPATSNRTVLFTFCSLVVVSPRFHPGPGSRIAAVLHVGTGDDGYPGANVSFLMLALPTIGPWSNA